MLGTAMDSSESQQACRAFVANAVIRHLDLTLCPNVFVNPRAYIVCRPDVPSKNCIDPSVTYQALGALNRAPIYARSVTNTENVHIIGLRFKTQDALQHRIGTTYQQLEISFRHSGVRRKL